MARSRFLVMAKPPLVVRKSLENWLETMGLKARLQGAMFDPANWHQSLSDRFFQRSCIEPLKRACARVRAPACTLAMNRVRGSAGPEVFHWAFHARGKPPCFTGLLTEVNRALIAEGLPASGGHAPHITISYQAPGALRTHPIRSILWTIDEILLVEGHSLGDHDERYRYEVIDHWPLLPLAPARQLDLFDGHGPG
jgi:2'-5' RNA ligase